MLSPTPLENKSGVADSSSETPPPLRKYLWQIDPQILSDWEFWDAIARISMTASEHADISPYWKLAYLQLAFACDHLSALIFRQDQRKEFGP
jgi:hypothetical protein